MINDDLYFFSIIWGEGINHKKDIFDMIYEDPKINILTILEFEPENISELIKAIYSYEYLPFEHHESKLRDLRKGTSEIVLIFGKIKFPRNFYWGDPNKKYLNSRYLNTLKEKIRLAYDPKVNGKYTHEHVVHFSDNNAQAHRFLKYLGFNKGLDYFREKPNPLFKVPYFLQPFTSFSIKDIYFKDIFANILINQKPLKKKLVSITDTPHAEFLNGNVKKYKDYVSKYSSGPLLGGELYFRYCIKKFSKLSKDFEYLKKPFDLEYIVVEKINNGYKILDGLHRASILLNTGMKKIRVAIIDSI